MATSVPAHPPAPLFVIGSLVVACCARVSRCPEPGESLSATGFIMEAGGKGFNVALAAHRLGVPVDGLFAVGDDAPGAFLRRAFVLWGLDESLIETVDSATGAGVGLIQDDGENRIAVYPGANAALRADHVAAKADRLRAAGLVFAQFEVSDDPIIAAFRLAREAGVKTMLNPSPYRSIHPDLLALTDILVVNEGEAAALASDRLWHDMPDRLAESLAAEGVRSFILTRGASGALAWAEGRRIEQAAFPVNAVDSIGAGDAFTGGLIAALSRGEDLPLAVRWGCAAGAWAATRLGVAEALPGMDDLQTMLVRTA